MLSIRTIIVLVLAIVIAVTLVPTVWESVWTGDVINTSGTNQGVNGTTWTLLKLVPMLFVALLVIVGALLSAGYKVPGT